MSPPRLASCLPPVITAALRAHPSAPAVVQVDGKPWEAPHDVQALFAYQSQWKGAPAEAPEGWPHALEWVQIASAGVDTFPAWGHAVPLVSRAAGIQGDTIAEYVVAAIFAHEKRFWNGTIDRRAHWVPYEAGSVAGRHLGIAGLGAIGRAIARLALAVGMTVSGLNRGGAPMAGVHIVTGIEELAARCDHLVLALPLTVATRGIVNATLLARAKRGLHLINIARGPIVDQDALLAALDHGRIAAATLDVTDPEPLPDGHPLYAHPAVRLTPHVSGAVPDSERRLIDALLANLDSWLAGRLLCGRVLPQLGY